MKQIKTYTLGWDTNLKMGYLSLTDEESEIHHFSEIPASEFLILLSMLQMNNLQIDNQKWLISGWDSHKK